MDVFNSWDREYREPFGAVPAGRPVRFRIRVPAEAGAQSAYLRLIPDGETPLRVDMQRLPCAGTADFFCEYALALPGLYWYHFVLGTDRGPRYVTRIVDGTGGVTADEGSQWQLTVYDPAFCTPEWIRGGVMYQIFPDRFCRQGLPPTRQPAGRIVRSDWGGTPEYSGEREGYFLNNTYFGGNLEGVRSRLGYLRSLGVTALYLNPVFEAHSNHRYNTADYMKIDPMLGDEAAFTALCREAEGLGIRVILDGVFSHTGDDSVYFNRSGRYGADTGAYRSRQSPYYAWYDFRRWPDDYRCWWNYRTLPEVNESEPGYRAFVLGERGVLRHWQRAGAKGWRLDVADELPDDFLAGLRRAVKSADPEALVIGEVWEDASNKISYGVRRRYLLGGELDAAMNYPLREAVLRFLRGGEARSLHSTVMTQLEHYPAQTVAVQMNILSTHDTDRLLTALAGEDAAGRSRQWKHDHPLPPARRAAGLELAALAATIQFFMPGVPCVYYGDEIGMEGYSDPFNRGCFPWGRENDGGMPALYRWLGTVRAACPALRQGLYRTRAAEGGLFAFERGEGEERLLCAVNRSDGPASLPAGLFDGFRPLPFFGKAEPAGCLGPRSFRLFAAGGWAARLAAPGSAS